MSVNRSDKQSSSKRNSPSGKAGWGRRIELAFLQAQSFQGERITLDEFGALVAAEEGRLKPYKKPTVNAWFNERGQPSLTAFEAIARIADCDPWWVVWEVGRAPRNVIGQGERLPRSKRRLAAQ